MVGIRTSEILGARKQPDRDPWLVKAITDRWYEQYVEAGKTERAFALEGSRVRASWAGDCAKKIGYHVAGVPESDPPTVADAWRFGLGNMVHEMLQDVICERFPESTPEKKIRIGDIGSGHMDIEVVDGTMIVSVEAKTKNGFGFKKMFGKYGEGPSYKAVIQAALCAANSDTPPERMIVVYFAMEVMSPTEAARLKIAGEYGRFAAQWTYNRDEYEALAHEEMARLERIVQLVDNGELDLVPRIIPNPDLPTHLVITPSQGEIQQYEQATAQTFGTSRTWECNYCSFQSHCQDDLNRQKLEESVQQVKDTFEETEES